MRHSDETKSEFIARVMRSKGFGRMEVAAAPRKPLPQRSREEIAREHDEHQDRYFGQTYQYGPAEKWGWSI